jgi:hypothetical protein
MRFRSLTEKELPRLYQQNSEAVTDKIVRFARGSARRARKLDGKAPHRSATIGGAQFLSGSIQL